MSLLDVVAGAGIQPAADQRKRVRGEICGNRHHPSLIATVVLNSIDQAERLQALQSAKECDRD